MMLSVNRKIPSVFGGNINIYGEDSTYSVNTDAAKRGLRYLKKDPDAALILSGIKSYSLALKNGVSIAPVSEIVLSFDSWDDSENETVTVIYRYDRLSGQDSEKMPWAKARKMFLDAVAEGTNSYGD